MNYLKSLQHLPAKLYHAETLDYRTRILASGGSISEASLDAIEKFVQDCKNALIWDKLIEVAPFAGANLSAALVKLIYPAGSGVLTNVNFIAGDYTERGSNGGLLGDGTTKYLDTGFNAQTYLPANAHLSFYLREDVASAGNRSMLGVVSGTDGFWLGSQIPASQVDIRLGQTITATLAQPFTKGFYTGSRSSNTQLRLYKDGQPVATNTNATSPTRPNSSLFAWAFNSSGAPSAILPVRGSFYSIGQSLNDAEALALHEAVRTLQRNLNRDVN